MGSLLMEDLSFTHAFASHTQKVSHFILFYFILLSFAKLVNDTTNSENTKAKCRGPTITVANYSGPLD